MLPKLIVILGATATGKTSFAAHLAYEIDAEIISGDSRQVYRNMNIGTGKDLDDYLVNGKPIHYHLIDIVDAGEQFTVYDFRKAFFTTYDKIKEKNKNAILCGGSGMYIESVLSNYNLVDVPLNDNYRKELEKFSDDELISMLQKMKKLHNKTDIDNRKRLIRALEIEKFSSDNIDIQKESEVIESIIFGVNVNREIRRKRISERLKKRLENGMIQEVEYLLQKGLLPEQLIYYGLEYKYITNFIIGKLTYEEMFTQLETAIHQFAKRQMTWFRRMERNGFHIHWIDGELSMENKINVAIKFLKQ